MVTGDHCRLAWRSDGSVDAPVIILSNSLGTNMTMWDEQVAALASHFRVLRYDTRGHGKSDAPPGAYALDRLGRDVLELADALEIDRFGFCGLSLGGMIAQWLGWRATDRLERLVIANSSPFMGPASAWDARIDTVREQGIDAISGAVVERWFTPQFRRNIASVKAILDGFLETPAEGYAGCCAAIRDMDMRAALPLIRVPSLIIGGSEDPATPPEHTRLLVEGIIGAESVMLRAAHLSNIEQPNEFNQALLDFLRR